MLVTRYARMRKGKESFLCVELQLVSSVELGQLVAQLSPRKTHPFTEIKRRLPLEDERTYLDTYSFLFGGIPFATKTSRIVTRDVTLLRADYDLRGAPRARNVASKYFKAAWRASLQREGEDYARKLDEGKRTAPSNAFGLRIPYV